MIKIKHSNSLQSAYCHLSELLYVNKGDNVYGGQTIGTVGPKYISNGKNKYYKALENEMIIMARDYYANNKSELPYGQLNQEGNYIYYKKITLDELEQGGFITQDIVDTDKNKCDGYVDVNYNNSNYEYTACLNCHNSYVTAIVVLGMMRLKMD